MPVCCVGQVPLTDNVDRGCVRQDGPGIAPGRLQRIRDTTHALGRSSALFVVVTDVKWPEAAGP